MLVISATQLWALTDRMVRAISSRDHRRRSSGDLQHYTPATVSAACEARSLLGSAGRPALRGAVVMAMLGDVTTLVHA